MTTTDRPHVIDIHNVSKAFGDKVILKDVSYTIPDLPDVGELIVLVGPSGCGKTTLLNMIAGIIPPTSGSIHCLGQPVLEPHPSRSFVFQSYNNLPWRTVFENAAFGLQLAGKPAKEIREEVNHWLNRVGLYPMADRYPRQLSGGQQQRLALARSLALRPRVLLMDEPFGALDVGIRLEMQDLLWEMWKDIEGTVILVTHDLDEAVYLGREVLVMAPDPGRIHRILPIGLGEDRTRAVERSPEYQRYREEIRTEVRAVARRSA